MEKHGVREKEEEKFQVRDAKKDLQAKQISMNLGEVLGYVLE